MCKLHGPISLATGYGTSILRIGVPGLASNTGASCRDLPSVNMRTRSEEPAGVKALGGVYGYIMQSSLPSELVDLVYLRISQINNCAYCLDMHTRDLLKKGQRIEKIALVQAWPEAGNRLRRA